MTLHRMFCIGLLIFCAACGSGSPEPLTPGEMKEFASLCDKANEGQDFKCGLENPLIESAR